VQLPLDPEFFDDGQFADQGCKFMKEFGSDILKSVYKESNEYFLKYITEVGELGKSMNTRVPRQYFLAKAYKKTFQLTFAFKLRSAFEPRQAFKLIGHLSYRLAFKLIWHLSLLLAFKDQQAYKLIKAFKLTLAFKLRSAFKPRQAFKLT
jgi:hypothetical protein